MKSSIEKIIDIDSILSQKLGSKRRYVPSFLVSWLKRIAHQDDVNGFLSTHQDLVGVDWLEATLDHLSIKLDIRGKENLPSKDDQRLYTFVSNHPLGGIDGVALGAIIGKQYDGNFKYLVNDLLMHLPGLAPLCIPINKTGAQSRQFPAMVEAGFKGNTHILMFPAGLCSRKTNGKIRDIAWTKTFITKSIETHRDVVPIHFSGQNSAFFYRLANLCKAIGLKVNIAMLFLADEMYKNVGSTFTVTIGKPIRWQTFDKSKTPLQWAQDVRERVYQLSEEKA